MLEKQQKDLLRNILVGMMPKYALIKIPKVLSKELNSMIDKMVDEIYLVMRNNESNSDYLKSVVKLDWPSYFNRINRELYNLNKTKQKIK